MKKQINMEKLLQYLADGYILEFESDQACMEYFNVYDFQTFHTVEEMKDFQGNYGFNIGKKRYHIDHDFALDVYENKCIMEELKVNDVLHATLKDGLTIHGQIDKIADTEFWIDDDLSGDILVLQFSEVETIHGIY